MSEHSGRITFDAETYRQAKRAWERGRFGPEWQELRFISWNRGYPYPPEGDPDEDARNDAHPSQRIIIWWALRDRAPETIGFARESRSWHEVVNRIIESEDVLRDGIDDREYDADQERSEWPKPLEATATLGNVLQRIADSVGVEAPAGARGGYRQAHEQVQAWHRSTRS